jgi:hypothetical protein
VCVCMCVCVCVYVCARTGSRERMGGRREQTGDRRQQTADGRQQIGDRRQQTREQIVLSTPGSNLSTWCCAVSLAVHPLATWCCASARANRRDVRGLEQSARGRYMHCIRIARHLQMVLLTAHHRDSIWKPGEGVQGAVETAETHESSKQSMYFRKGVRRHRVCSPPAGTDCKPCQLELRTAEPKQVVQMMLAYIISHKLLSATK